MMKTFDFLKDKFMQLKLDFYLALEMCKESDNNDAERFVNFCAIQSQLRYVHCLWKHTLL